MPNAEIAARLLAELDAYEGGSQDIVRLQRAILGHGQAMEAMPPEWRSRLDTWEGALETMRFTYAEEELRAGALEVVREIREALGRLRAA